MIAFLITGCKDKSTEPEPGTFQLLKASADDVTLRSSQSTPDIPATATFTIDFSTALNQQQAQNSIRIVSLENDEAVSSDITFENNGNSVVITPQQTLNWLHEYKLEISDELESAEGAHFPGVEFLFETKNGSGEIVSITVNNTELPEQSVIRNVTYNDVTVEIVFSESLNEQNLQNDIRITPSFASDFSLSPDGKTVTITNTEDLDYYRHYFVNISGDLSFENGFEFDEFNTRFQTGLNSEPKFPQISDEELLTKIQEATFGYFWDFAHPVSGLARERNTSGDTVTIGGSGFGVMAILVGIHRGFITRNEGVERLQKIVDFLESADRFHGVWPHWMNGNTGNAIPFSQYDDGGDLVETAFMAQGLITVREFLNEGIEEEGNLIDQINGLLDTIEWNWYTQGGQDVLYWHWSENHEWRMNHQIQGYNEALIVYVLAASSDDYGINPEVYQQGWARSGGIVNGKSFYGITLPVGFDYGGPLFFAHYSFLGLDPRNLSDSYANYWTQNQNHTLINREHNIVNPNNFVGYSANSWGLTASDNPEGYKAHEPTHDDGTITPTAAVSSIPYTPDESMDAIRHFYYALGDKLWGEYGFHDAFNPTQGWWANSYLAIDQGPIIIMIENHRSGLLWDLFMDAPEVQSALQELGFTTNE
ncbi:glucoamylase family protein [Rhodohalobacter sp. 614A]|uniref:glucoamylase family protein n=1 Tax=Rhodohalobacter sp. 614A TaxID=2908649 RepID=UPI001F296259|nr:glucoamylase family protein [Rhodohalobacter sp. 614A]